MNHSYNKFFKENKALSQAIRLLTVYYFRRIYIDWLSNILAQKLIYGIKKEEAIDEITKNNELNTFKFYIINNGINP